MFSRILKGNSKKHVSEEENDICQEGSDQEYERSYEEEETESEPSEVEVNVRSTRNLFQSAKNGESFFKRIIKGKMEDEISVQSSDHVHLYLAREASEQTFQKEEQRRKIFDQYKQREDHDLQYAMKQSKLQQKVQELQYQQQLDSNFNLLHSDTALHDYHIPLHPPDISEEEALKLSILESEQLRAIQEADCHSPEAALLLLTPSFHTPQPPYNHSGSYNLSENYSQGLPYSLNPSHLSAVSEKTISGLTGKKTSSRRIAEADHHPHQSSSSKSNNNETTLDDPEVKAFMARRLAKKEIKRNEEIVLEAQSMKIAPERIMTEILARSTSMQMPPRTTPKRLQERSTSEQFVPSDHSRKDANGNNASTALQMPLMQSSGKNTNTIRQQERQLQAAEQVPEVAFIAPQPPIQQQPLSQQAQKEKEQQQQAMKLLKKDIMRDMFQPQDPSSLQPFDQQGVPRASSYDSATLSISSKHMTNKHKKLSKPYQQQQHFRQNAAFDQQPQFWQSDPHANSSIGIIPEYQSTVQQQSLLSEEAVIPMTPNPWHILNTDNALALKAATALLKLARRHPLLASYQSGGGEGCREEAAVELAMTWLVQTAQTLPPIPLSKSKPVPSLEVNVAPDVCKNSNIGDYNVMQQCSSVSTYVQQQQLSQRRQQRTDSRLSSDPSSSSADGRSPVPPVSVQQRPQQQKQQQLSVMVPAAIVADDRPWRCGVCTLINIPDHLACNACGSPRC